MKKTITITTDFGDQFAAAQLKAVVAKLGFFDNLIENHSVTPYSIAEGAFQIATLSQFTPKNTVHVGVVDPGVGSNRRGIIIQTKKSWFVGPDNGLLHRAAKNEVIENVWEIKKRIVNPHASTTFHGRDIFIKIAVLITQKKHPFSFGAIKTPSSSLISIKFESGQVIHVDHYGNIKIFYLQAILHKRQLIIKTKKKTITIPFVKTFSDVDVGKPLAYLGSSNTLELAINQKNAAKRYNIQVGDMLKVI